jgi:hypothetical protein
MIRGVLFSKSTPRAPLKNLIKKEKGSPFCYQYGELYFEKFSSTFFKRWRGGGCVSLLVASRRRNHLGAFLFVSWQSLAIAAELAEPVFILRLYGQKKKRLRNLAYLRSGEK